MNPQKEFMQVNIPVPERVMDAIMHISRLGGTPFVVGGAVRSAVMRQAWGVEIEDKDIDVEVFDFTHDQLVAALSMFGKVDTVGASFGVTKLFIDGKDFDFSLPRRENKRGAGHREFEIQVDGSMTMKEAAARRDFTINALSWNPFTAHIIDDFGGVQDIRDRVLRPTSAAFGEDPLRVLRGMQFAARFNMTLAEEARNTCAALLVEFFDLARERVWGEFEKWAARGVKPSAGLNFLVDAGWIVPDVTPAMVVAADMHVETVRSTRATWIKAMLEMGKGDEEELIIQAKVRFPFIAEMVGMVGAFPELSRLMGCEQDAVWHPEGDAFIHTGLVCDALANQCVRDGVESERRVRLMFGALCHDLGKPDTSFTSADGHIRSPGHSEAGEGIARILMGRIGRGSDEQKSADPVIEAAAKLTRLHMRHVGFSGAKSAVKRLALLIDIRDLAQIVEADHSGRPPIPAEMPDEMRRLLEMAGDLKIEASAPKRILTGQHLIDRGFKQGKHIGVILNAAFEAQIEGEFEDEIGALEWFNANQEMLAAV